ncbi:hypothetical protein DSY14_14345, partial [Nocardiopsis sp. MG754419]|nr:hypothetical protein [Nocardiopsis sp. MG754419]
MTGVAPTGFSPAARRDARLSGRRSWNRERRRPHHRRRSEGPLVTASLGGTIEWHGPLLYRTTATPVLDVVSFPGSDPLVGTTPAFGTSAVGCVARPAGPRRCPGALP